MGAIHYATNSRLTACGLSTDFAIHTNEPQTVTQCNPCLAAAGEMEGCPGGCGGALADSDGFLACSCYLAGYTAGLAAALASDRRQV